MARKPSKQTYFITVITSVKPARFNRPRLPAAGEGFQHTFQAEFLVQDLIGAETVALFELPIQAGHHVLES